MKATTLLLVFTALLMVNCGKKEQIQPVIQQNTTEPDNGNGSGNAGNTSSVNTFGFDIFRLIVNDESNDENIFISPTSISLALSMTLNGAKGTTKDSIAYALRLKDTTMTDINTAARELTETLTNVDENVLLEIANSIWYHEDLEVQQNFVEVNQEYYDAKVSALDFSDPSSLDTINGWVAEKTHDKIPTIIEQIDPSLVMFLINAIYFNGTWTLGFNEESTYSTSFYPNDAEFMSVEMMNFEEEIPYYENDLFQACELDYGNGDYSMLIFLPKVSYSTDTVIAALNNENWDNWTSSLTADTVDLHLPKFSFSYNKMLNDVLVQMGMGIAFTSMADFSLIREGGGIYIDYVLHKSFVDVNESGTEAAAVTVVGMITTSGQEDTNRYMLVNKPFVFTIREKTSNTVIFMGRVVRPGYAE